ncbi:MAG: two-component system sensor histidine kinase NtrB [Chitinispirillaceae bacterium]
MSKKQLETVFDSISDLICIVDSDYRIVRANLRFARIVKQDILSILGKECWKVFWKREKRCEQCPARHTFESGDPSKVQMNCCFGDSELFFETSTYPVCDDSGKVVQVIECMRELTEEKKMLEQLIRSEKLASIGIMTAGIAHEMNNPLSGISGTAYNMLQMPSKYGLNEKGVDRVTTILECARRATVIMKDLLHLSRKHKSQKVFVDVNQLVTSSVKAVHIDDGKCLVRKEFRFDEQIPPLKCSPAKIEQVVINVVANAIKSVQEKGEQCEREGRDYAGEIVVSTFKTGRDLLISVADNGVGIAQDIRSKIFDPFFSTRPPGQGTGLGLSVCHKIIEEHGGKIFFESAGERTIFSVQLPFEQPSLMKDLE